MVAKKPGLIARCADVSDVQNAVRSASAKPEFSPPSGAAVTALLVSVPAKAVL